MKRIYIIAGCNGAGKTTASYTVLPEILKCDEFVNADEIARGLSPFKPESVAIQAGRLMLNRIDELLKKEVSFAIETTLATKSYQNLIVKAKEKGYQTTIVFFWLNSVQLAKERVRFRIKEGGHAIPEEVIERRYYSGLKNFFTIYMNIVTNWQFYDNSKIKQEIIAYADNGEMNILEDIKWRKINEQYK